MLNMLFGTDFMVLDGRCSRGVYASFIKSFLPGVDYFIVLDTEGLQSLNKCDKNYDTKLMLFTFSVSQLILFNTAQPQEGTIDKMAVAL